VSVQPWSTVEIPNWPPRASREIRTQFFTQMLRRGSMISLARPRRLRLVGYRIGPLDSFNIPLSVLLDCKALYSLSINGYYLVLVNTRRMRLNGPLLAPTLPILFFTLRFSLSFMIYCPCMQLIKVRYVRKGCDEMIQMKRGLFGAIMSVRGGRARTNVACEEPARTEPTAESEHDGPTWQYDSHHGRFPRMIRDSRPWTYHPDSRSSR
jgi:hypothetical protein